jgi:hypothetical protein
VAAVLGLRSGCSDRVIAGLRTLGMGRSRWSAQALIRNHAPLRGATVGTKTGSPRAVGLCGSWAAGFARGSVEPGRAEGAQLCWRAVGRHRFTLARSRPLIRLVLEDDLIDPVQAPLPLLDDLRLERPVPVPGHLEPDLAGAPGQHRLGPGPVADVPGLVACRVFFSWPRCSVSSWSRAVSITTLVSCLSSPSGPVRDRPCSRARRTSSSAATCSAVVPASSSSRSLVSRSSRHLSR